VIFLP